MRDHICYYRIVKYLFKRDNIYNIMVKYLFMKDNIYNIMVKYLLMKDHIYITERSSIYS